MEKLKDKRVFITGGAQGIGAVLVRDFVKQGCRGSRAWGKIYSG